ncbi:hypothetical protein BaRGS_00003455, partial [Batillaria attramentaria]
MVQREARKKPPPFARRIPMRGSERSQQSRGLISFNGLDSRGKNVQRVFLVHVKILPQWKSTYMSMASIVKPFRFSVIRKKD